MRDWWQLWPQHFKPTTCAGLVRRALELPGQAASVGLGKHNRQDTKLRRSTVRWIPRDKDWRDLWDRLRMMALEANQKAFGFELYDLPELQFAEYPADVQGHYDFHEDLDWVTTESSQRKLTLVMQLSAPDAYTGGDLELQEAPLPSEFRRQGSVLVFPSFLRHRVQPVTQGVRYSLVGWYTGPPFR